jgi:hypothetical protein
MSSTEDSDHESGRSPIGRRHTPDPVEGEPAKTGGSERGEKQPSPDPREHPIVPPDYSKMTEAQLRNIQSLVSQNLAAMKKKRARKTGGPGGLELGDAMDVDEVSNGGKPRKDIMGSFKPVPFDLKKYSFKVWR